MEIFGFVFWPEPDPDSPDPPALRAARRRRLLIGAASLLLLAAAAWLLRPAYHRLRATLFLASGEAFAAKRDFASARIQFVNAYRHDPSRHDLYEKLAAVLRAEGSPDHAVCLARAYALAPERFDLALAALQGAVETRQSQVAAAIIHEALPRFQDRPEFVYWAGAALLQNGRFQEGREFLRRAADLAPGDNRFQIAVGTLELASSDAQTSLLGKARLETLLAQPGFPHRAAATRPLAQRALAHNPAESARLWSQVVATPNASWPDRLEHFDALRRADPNRARALLDDLWRLASAPPENADIIQRTDALAGRAEARARLNSLPEPDAAHPRAVFLACAFLESERDWKTLLATVADAIANGADANWTAQDRIQALLWKALAHIRLDDPDAAASSLRAALTALPGHLDTLRAAQWLQARELSLGAAHFFEAAALPNSPCRFDALRGLAAVRQRLHDTEGELSAGERLLQLAPFNPVYQNNVASLLLDLDRDIPRALRLAAEAAAAAPRLPEVLDTHARALARSRKPREGLAIYESMPPAARGHPVIRLHEAETLVLAGRPSDARAILEPINRIALPEPARRLHTRLSAEIVTGCPMVGLPEQLPEINRSSAPMPPPPGS